MNTTWAQCEWSAGKLPTRSGSAMPSHSRSVRQSGFCRTNSGSMPGSLAAYRMARPCALLLLNNREVACCSPICYKRPIRPFPHGRQSCGKMGRLSSLPLHSFRACFRYTKARVSCGHVVLFDLRGRLLSRVPFRRFPPAVKAKLATMKAGEPNECAQAPGD